MKGKRYFDDYAGVAENLKRLNGEKLPVELYAVLDHVSKSGMYRRISIFYIKENTPICICREAGISGCGMDMGFSLAYDIYMEAYGKDHAYQENLKFHWM